MNQFETQKAIDNAYKTAMKRNPKKLSAPMSRLAKQGRLKGRMLDYGCGHGTDAAILDINECLVACEKYDPFYYPYEPEGKFDVVTCIYVLNVLPLREQRKVLERIYDLLKDDGSAYIAVRRDQGVANGFTSMGTYQVNVKLLFEKVASSGGYDIYEMNKGEVARDEIASWIQDL